MLYAVVPPDLEDLPDDLQKLTGDDVAVVYEVREPVSSTNRREVIRYGKNLMTLAKDRPTLPIRFGTVAESEVELGQLIKEREAEWRRRLDVVAGHVEMLVHIDSAETGPVVPMTSGRDYLMAKVAASRSRAQQVEQVERLLGALVRETRVLDDGQSLRLACLVHRSALPEFRSTVRGMPCTGPWPPFSFSEEPE